MEKHDDIPLYWNKLFTTFLKETSFKISENNKKRQTFLSFPLQVFFKQQPGRGCFRWHHDLSDDLPKLVPLMTFNTGKISLKSTWNTCSHKKRRSFLNKKFNTTKLDNPEYPEERESFSSPVSSNYHAVGCLKARIFFVTTLGFFPKLPQCKQRLTNLHPRKLTSPLQKGLFQ